MSASVNQIPRTVRNIALRNIEQTLDTIWGVKC
jgi:hypothetical protein